MISIWLVSQTRNLFYSFLCQSSRKHQWKSFQALKSWAITNQTNLRKRNSMGLKTKEKEDSSLSKIEGTVKNEFKPQAIINLALQKAFSSKTQGSSKSLFMYESPLNKDWVKTRISKKWMVWKKAWRHKWGIISVVWLCDFNYEWWMDGKTWMATKHFTAWPYE